MIESLQYTAGVMFWALVNLALASLWGAVIGAVLWKVIGKKNDD